MLQSHYRSPVDYSVSSLGETRAALIRCYSTLQLLKEIPESLPADRKAASGNDKFQARQKAYVGKIRELMEKFDAALDDDFNTAQGLGYVFDVVRLTNNFIAAEKNIIAAGTSAAVAQAGRAFGHFGAVLGILQDEPTHFFLTDKEMESRKRDLDKAEIESLILARQEARKAKDWARADEIRSKLAGLQVLLKDSQDGTTWSIE
jgi:cysteinyl-tRNA synthetase